MRSFLIIIRCVVPAVLALVAPEVGASQSSLPGTERLAPPKDVVAEQQKQEEGYFLQRIADAEKIRDERWKPDFASASAYERSSAAQRGLLREMLGLPSPSTRPGKATVEAVVDTSGCRIERVTIPLDPGLSARGLLFSPPGGGPHPLIIACPDADCIPERFSGLAKNAATPAWLAALIARGAAVYIPQSIERLQDHPYCKTTNGKDRRWILYRLGYVVGRAMPGLDVQDVLAATDYLAARPDIDAKRMGIVGVGQGGMTALYAAALEPRIAAGGVANYFRNRNRCWEEPVDRRLPGQLLAFGDAELAALIAPRFLAIVGSAGGPTPDAEVQSEVIRAARFYRGLSVDRQLVVATNVAESDLESHAVLAVADALGLPKPDGRAVEWSTPVPEGSIEIIRNRHFQERLQYLRALIRGSEGQRQERWGITTQPAAEFDKIRGRMMEDYRRLVGEVTPQALPLNAHTQLALITDKYKAYRVMLDVVAGVQVYGNLLIPRQTNGRVPAMICQHGLNGTPEMITGLGQEKDEPYHEFGRHLAERGYVVFAPLLLHHYPVKHINDLVRQADAVGMMRIALPIAKTQRVVDFLCSLPEVDTKRIGYYGLSYGGYSAIWMAPLLDRLAAVVVSGHFNDWRAKITSDENPASYLWHPDEDFYNWNILHRFAHPELIAMVAPRPVCIEFGERDSITTPQWTEYAWRQVAAIRDHLGLTDRVELGRYDGVHEVHGVETFDFLDRFLRPEQPVGRDYEYTMRGLHDRYHLNELYQVLDTPYLRHTLDSRDESRLSGRFWMPAGAKDLRGMAVKLSLVGHPGPLEIRFGSTARQSDLGIARLDPGTVLPLFEHWYECGLPATAVKAGQLVHYELSCAGGRAPADCYRVYGPQPIGGAELSGRFALSYRVLTDRPEDRIDLPGKQHPFQYLREMLGPYYAGSNDKPSPGRPAQAGECAVDDKWIIRYIADADNVLPTAAEDLRQFFAARFGVNVRASPKADPTGPQGIDLVVRPDAEQLRQVGTSEGYRVEVQPDRITISGRTARGVMRGVYWIEDMMSFNGGPRLAPGQTVRNCKFDRRLTCSVVPGSTKYVETSQPLLYTDGLLQRISHQGFNVVWVWMNVEEMAHNSKVFPELNDAEAAVRFARVRDLTERAKKFGIDVYIYFAQYCHHWVPAWFYEKHPEAKGTAWGNAMCTSDPKVREWNAEAIRNLVEQAPAVKGLVIIFDSEGLYYCGTSEDTRKRCPRCNKRTCDEIALEFIHTLNNALHTDGPGRELVVWPYGDASSVPQPWVLRVIAQLPKVVLFQGDFSKGAVTEKDGIRHRTGDYNISTIGPPESFGIQYEAAKRAGIGVLAKTEHAVSQEFIGIPYIPCLQQWHRRMEAMLQFDLAGLFANWCHYGYTPSRPAEIMMWYSWAPAPPIEELLTNMATRDFGEPASRHVVAAWEHFTLGIRHYPYSDAVARVPGGPIQKGPTQPLWLDPRIQSPLPWRAWQNDLKWTTPWGPQVTAKHFRLLEREFDLGIAEMEQARDLAVAAVRKKALEDELGIARTIRASVHSILNLIEWVPIRDAFAAAPPGPQRDTLREQLIRLARDELANAQAALPVIEADSRLGAASEGGGMQAGGLFSPALVRHKIGLIEDLLDRQLAEP